MNNQIDRDVFVLTDTFKDPIFYVRGTNSIPIVFHFRDFTIPSDSQAYYYVKKPSGKSSFNLASQLSNTVTVDVKDQDFSELGFCHLQIQIVSGEKTLVSFDQPVAVKENYTDGQSEESKNESNAFVLQNQGIENSGKFLGIDETGNVVPRYAPGSGTGSTVSVSETVTGDPGTNASVENVGDSQNVKLKFTIPKGDTGQRGEKGNTGADGKAATIRVGSVTTGDTAKVTNSGTETDAVFDFVIPQGESSGGTPSVQEISQATETTLGGIRAKQRTTESVEAAIDQTSGKIYVPEQSAPTQEQVSQAVENYFTENPVESIIQAGFANEQLGLKFIPGYIMTSGAIGGASEDRKITDYILCGENVEVKYCGEYNAYDVVLAVAFFDKNKKFISGEKQKAQGKIESTISPAGTEYVVLGYFPTALNYWYLSIGEPAIVKKIEETKGEIEVLDIDKLNKIYGKNLFDSSSVEDASYLDYNGVILTNEYSGNYYTSYPIYVKPNTTYTLSLANMGAVRPYCEYDKNGVYVAEGTSTPDESTPLTFTTNERTSFVRICGFKTSISRQQLEIGSSKTEYEEYTDNYPTRKNTKDIDLIKEKLNMETGVEFKAILPSKLYSINGVSLPVYFENVLMKSLNDTGDVHFTIGNRTNKLQQLLSDSPGEKPFVCTVMRGLEKLKNQDFVLNVVDKSVISGKTINILFVGDSFTDNGTYVSETKRLLESGGATVNLIGTCGTKDCKHEGLSGGIIKNTFLDNSAGVARIVDVTGVTDAPNTAYPGRTYSDDTGKQWSIRGSKINPDGTGKIVVTNYTAKEEDFNSFPSSGTLTKVSEGNGDSTISYSNPIPAYYNPFINGSSGKFDMNWYLSTWKFQNPDIVVLQFTYNDIPEWATEEQLKSVTDDFVTAVKNIHDSLQNAKIIISVEPYGAINTNNGWNGKKKSVLQWVEMLKETFETEQYQEYVKIAPSYACVDMENGYSDNLIAPSSRYPDIEEYSSGDGIHPSSKGMCQIADCIYPIIASFVL